MSRLRSVVQRTFGDEIMNSWKYLLAAATTAVVLNFSIAAPSDVALPRGWVASGDFGRHFLTEQRTELANLTKCDCAGQRHRCSQAR